MVDDTPVRRRPTGRRRRPGRTLAEKLDHLFRTIHPPERGEYSLEEAAAEIRRRGGPTVSATYLWLLRKGRRDNPTRTHLQALADFFGVSPLYFFDDEAAERTDAQLERLAVLRDPEVRRLALRAAPLSPKTLRALTEMVERAREIEGIPDDAEERPSPRPRRGRPWRRTTEESDGPSGPEPNEDEDESA
jgi:transcriptional regulator with XRE-family HTH domain